MLDVAHAWEAHSTEITRYIASRVATREDAEDLCAAVFTEVCAHAAHYQERGQLRGWLYCIARSRIIDHRRAQAIRPAVPLVAAAAVPIEGPEDSAVDREYCRALLLRLPATQRRAVALRYWGDYSSGQLGWAFGTSGAGKALQARGIRQLQRMVACGE